MKKYITLFTVLFLAFPAFAGKRKPSNYSTTPSTSTIKELKEGYSGVNTKMYQIIDKTHNIVCYGSLQEVPGSSVASSISCVKVDNAVE